MTGGPDPALPALSALSAEVDHLVIAAATLEQGAAWCEATLGVAPGAGGKHELFGTHNRLLSIISEAFPRSYLEIIAIDADAPPPARPRWFGLDGPALRSRLAASGPLLLHVVARTPALDRHLATLEQAGVDAGEVLAASRQTARGLMQWRIAVRRDGTLLYRGALPTLIEWISVHPTAAMAASPVRLRDLSLAGLPEEAVAALGLGGVHFAGAPRGNIGRPALCATLDTPRGAVVLESA